jgi:hypothetical protein
MFAAASAATFSSAAVYPGATNVHPLYIIKGHQYSVYITSHDASGAASTPVRYLIAVQDAKILMYLHEKASARACIPGVH